MTAGEILRRAGISVGAVRLALPRVDPDGVRVSVARSWFRMFWAPGITALALPWGVYLHPKRLNASAERLGVLLVHELTHVEQWRRLGTIGWLRCYLGDYLRRRRHGMAHFEAYRANPLEVEARALAGTFATG
ncbi:MAG: hypothetical protein QY307_02940 [Acidimicrobiia bacterium]|nr:MAG: hypothetical protein QY307_02940 [Acidimicrobiia bacterium]